MIPTLTTDRLTLRPYDRADFDAYAAFLASDSARFMGGPHGRDKAWDWFCHDTASWHLLGYGSLAVTDTASGAVLGYVGIHHPPHLPEPELGWFLHPTAQGKGIATEAAAATRDHVCATVTLPSLVSYIDPDNAASIRLAEKLGARHDTDAATPNNDPTLVYRHPLPEVRA